MIDERDKNGMLMPRRRFLRSTARVGIVGLAAPALTGWLTASAATSVRAYTRGYYALELDGSVMGVMSGVTGGGVTSDVVVEKPGPDRIRHKHLAGVKYEPISIEVSLPMAKPFYAWLKSSFEPQQKLLRKNGAILTLDYNGRVVARRDFINALVTEVEFPGCDAGSKEPASIGVTFAAERVTDTAPRASAPLPQAPKQRWISSNFRLNIQGLEAATVRANKIEALAIKLQTVDNPVGEMRDYQREPAGMEFPTLVVTIAEAYAKPMYDWLEDFVVRGNNGQDREKVGVLEYLAPDMKTPLLSLNLFGLGIFRATPDAVTAPTEQVRRTTVSMYCEMITADFK